MDPTPPRDAVLKVTDADGKRLVVPVEDVCIQVTELFCNETSYGLVLADAEDGTLKVALSGPDILPGDETDAAVEVLQQRAALMGLRVRSLVLVDAWSREATGRSFAELVIDPGGLPTYRPTLYVGPSRLGKQNAKLADLYDEVQAARGDARRAHRVW
jgi:hypothetical protein